MANLFVGLLTKILIYENKLRFSFVVRLNIHHKMKPGIDADGGIFGEFMCGYTQTIAGAYIRVIGWVFYLWGI
jgi:hypothetical protein